MGNCDELRRHSRGTYDAKPRAYKTQAALLTRLFELPKPQRYNMWMSDASWLELELVDDYSRNSLFECRGDCFYQVTSTANHEAEIAQSPC